jgi:integrase
VLAPAGLKRSTRRDVLDLTEGLVAEGKLATAVSLHRVLSGFFNWSVSRCVLTVSPMHGLKPPARVADRDRVPSDDELPLVWAAPKRLEAPWRPYVRFLLLTGQRAGEVARMRREDLNRDARPLEPARSASNLRLEARRAAHPAARHRAPAQPQDRHQQSAAWVYSRYPLPLREGVLQVPR